MRPLAVPEPGRPGILRWVATELDGLFAGDEVRASQILGGQQAADAALTAFDVTGYARRRNEVWPAQRRGASGLSPYIRHGLITLGRAWDHVDSGPSQDAAKFRDELLWQEYARHVYARLGTATGRSLRFSVGEFGEGQATQPWQGQARCLDDAWNELRSGWITNQQRMWLASHWTVRHRLGWRDGEDLFFRNLLDGSRAANRLGWQWTVGALTGKPYGFSRWQVDKRAPGLCQTCPLEQACPIEDWPPDVAPQPRAVVDPRMRRDAQVKQTAGPPSPQRSGTPEMTWLTAESLGGEDPALRANPNLPVAFVFDETLLMALRLAPGRLVFLAECLADLGRHHTVHLWRGKPTEVLAGIPLAATFAPVPGWRSRASALDLAEVHPWPWLRDPHRGPVTSFTAWARSTG
jgi:deoxyribodipyrimidine photo-lyase